jgi:hypothetical protein
VITLISSGTTDENNDSDDRYHHKHDQDAQQDFDGDQGVTFLIMARGSGVIAPALRGNCS